MVFFFKQSSCCFRHVVSLSSLAAGGDAFPVWPHVTFPTLKAPHRRPKHCFLCIIISQILSFLNTSSFRVVDINNQNTQLGVYFPPSQLWNENQDNKMITWCSSVQQLGTGSDIRYLSHVLASWRWMNEYLVSRSDVAMNLQEGRLRWKLSMWRLVSLSLFYSSMKFRRGSRTFNQK